MPTRTTRSAYSHRLTPHTTLGVGISAPGVYSFHDAPRDYDDFCQLYARWLNGPAPLHAGLTDDARRAEATLNWRVFGAAEPTLAHLDAAGWRPQMHPGPLGLWRVASVDMTGLPARIAEDGPTLNAVLYAARDAVKRGTRDLADVAGHLRTLPDAVQADIARHWSRLLRTFRPEAMLERTFAELWARNVVTDTGATAMLKNTWNNAGSAVSIFDHMVIAFGNQAYATQTGAAINHASGAQTSIACAGGVQVTNFAANGFITWSYGTANAETWQLGSSAPGNEGATALTVVSQTPGVSITHSAGDYIVNNPTTSDNPSSVANSADSGALAAGAFTYSGSGAGNRKVQIQYLWSTSTPAGAYTEAYMSNAGTIASGTTSTHIIMAPLTISGTVSQTITVTEQC